MMENSSCLRQAYREQMMAQRTQALNSLQKVQQLEQIMEPDQPNGSSDGQASELVVGPGEVCMSQ